MSEYTVTFPVHLGQNVWVDSSILQEKEKLPYGLPAYCIGEIRSLMIQVKRDTTVESMKVRIKESWIDKATNRPIYSYKYFKFSVGEIGKTIFDKKPEGGN